MATRYPAPKEATVEAWLGELVSVPTHVVRVQAPELERDTQGIFAEFVNDNNELGALVFADHDVVNFIGGAIAGVAIETLQEAHSNATLIDAGVESFREVVNAFASCLNTDFTKPLRLANIDVLPASITDEVKALWREPAGRRSYRVTVDDFGAGTMVLCLG